MMLSSITLIVFCLYTCIATFDYCIILYFQKMFKLFFNIQHCSSLPHWIFKNPLTFDEICQTAAVI